MKNYLECQVNFPGRAETANTLIFKGIKPTPPVRADVFSEYFEFSRS
jgi:hypothetical protein